MYPQLDVCVECERRCRRLLVVDRIFGRNGLDDEFASSDLAEAVAAFLATKRPPRVRLYALQCVLLARGSKFRLLTYFCNGMAGNNSPLLDVLDIILLFHG